jgi:hypothetical protein
VDKTILACRRFVLGSVIVSSVSCLMISSCFCNVGDLNVFVGRLMVILAAPAVEIRGRNGRKRVLSVRPRV